MIIEAIKKINPNAEVTVRGDTSSYEVEWLNGTTPISKADIEAQFTAVEFDMAMADLRAKRDRLLAESDFVMLEDAPIAEGDKAAWQTYRNRLRNITNGMDDITDIENTEWPTKPGA